ncbi:MAG TPA: YggS family pyridoxal phosphate-dependent enzyme [Terracidiphilus sp.]|nr:YggS family pyridoxal phosphate-dependent enzyme [Terracidiphilus sp.]
MTPLKENLARVKEQIEGACMRAGRRSHSVELMAVSKTYPASTIIEAEALGLRLFGENRVQEFAAKAPELEPLRATGALAASDAPILVHLIGHLQSNKAARAVELFDAIDSVDSLKLAERINDAAGRLGKHLPVLLEVKLSTEETKAGLDPTARETDELLERLPDLRHLDMRGLMTIAPFDVPEAETRACFHALHACRDRWSLRHPRLKFNTLSMGMSGDFALAIEEGATRVRIGTALFGKRPPTAAQLAEWPEEPEA